MLLLVLVMPPLDVRPIDAGVELVVELAGAVAWGRRGHLLRVQDLAALAAAVLSTRLERLHAVQARLHRAARARLPAHLLLHCAPPSLAPHSTPTHPAASARTPIQ